ncbi:MAG TPA: phosphate ABC transporter permease subunit PstC [Thermoplasmata archaeon]|nr:phosphate ABC transporter permease subunit PstC [Thermoplasmata archaeon]
MHPSPAPEKLRTQPLPPSSPPQSGPARSRVVRGLLATLPFLPALVPAAIITGIVLSLVSAGLEANLGSSFFSFVWNPAQNHWGIGVFLVGSFLTAIPALVFSMAIGLGLGIASTSYLPAYLSRWLDPFVDLLAGIPSVVYGIWAYVTLAPYFQNSFNPWLNLHLGVIPGFGGRLPSTGGQGLPISIFILTLMALPITTLLIRDALRSVPRDLWESGLALGATRWEVVRHVAIPYSSRGVLSAALLGFGRAFGETVAVAMLIGGATTLPTSIYSTSNTIPATMFGLLDSARNNSHFLSALADMGLVLLAITLVVNILGRRLISSVYAYEMAGL